MKIILEKINESHANKKYLKWLNDKEVTKYTELRHKETKLKDIVSFIKKTKDSKNTFIYGIFLNNKKNHIGNITLGPINSIHKSAEIGFFIGEKKFWNKGVMSVVIKKIILISKTKFKLKKLLGGCYEINHASKNLFLKNRFKLEGKLQSQIVFKRKRYNYLIFGYSIK